MGLVIGVLLGLLGGGGSILAVPALVYGAGVPLAAAIPTALVVVATSSAAAVLPRLGQVQWRIAAVFGGVGAVAAFGGAAINRLLDPAVLLLGFAALMVAAGLRMLGRSEPTGGACALPGGGVNWRSCLPKAIGAGAVVGFLTGLFGVGGGFLIIPALVLLLGLPMTVAVATSLVIIVANSVAGFIAHADGAPINYQVALVFTVAAVIGSVLAGRVGARLPVHLLQRWFGYLVLAVAVFVLAEASLSMIR